MGEETLPCATCPVTIGRRNRPIAEGSTWCRSCPFLPPAKPSANEGEVEVTEVADGVPEVVPSPAWHSPDDERTAPQGLELSDRARIERRLMASERMVAAALPRAEFLLFIEGTKESVAKFHTVTFQPVAVRSVVSLVIGCVALSLSIALFVLFAVKLASY